MTASFADQIGVSRVVFKPWGSEHIFAHTEHYVGKILRIDANCRLSRQYHEVKDETIYVLSGTLILEIGYKDDVQQFSVEAGKSFRIRPNTIHRFIAPQESGCKLIEVSTTQLDDVVRLEDVYGRQGTTAP